MDKYSIRGQIDSFLQPYQSDDADTAVPASKMMMIEYGLLLDMSIEIGSIGYRLYDHAISAHVGNLLD